MAAAMSWETLVPRSWNSGIATYCTPTVGRGCTPGSDGLASAIAWSVFSPKAADASLYSGISYVLSRLPAGTRAQPSSSPTICSYSLLEAHNMNPQAGDALRGVLGM